MAEFEGRKVTTGGQVRLILPFADSAISTLLYMASTRDCGPCPLKSRCCPVSPQRKVPRNVHEEARDVIITEWRGGRRGAFAMGLLHGAYCLGCCWVLMLLLFVGGLMNFYWVAGIAVYVLLEKTAPVGHWLSRLTGVGLVAWGGVTLFSLTRLVYIIQLGWLST